MAISALIVEDDENFVRILQIRLNSWRKDIAISVADSIEHARDALDRAESPFTFVILDQHLPDGLGADLLNHPKLELSAILAMSADKAPEIPGRAIKAGAHHFLGKAQVAEPLFLPLLEALLERKSLEKQLENSRIRESQLRTIKVLLSTLRHEINNPLGAVFGGTYLLRKTGTLEPDQAEALTLIEESSHRIKHVVERLCEAADLQEVTKGQERVFHVPGDKPWEGNS